MTRGNQADEQTARRERFAAIRRCSSCDPCGWALGTDGVPIDPAVRCTHNSPPPDRDDAAPDPEPDLFSEPRHGRTETED